MGDLYEECAGGELNEDVYENPMDEQQAPHRPPQQQPIPSRLPSNQVRAAPPKKPARPITTVIGDAHSPKMNSAGPWGVPLRQTGRIDEARDQHRRSIKSMPPQPANAPPVRSPSNLQDGEEPGSSSRKLNPPAGGVPSGVVAGGFRLPAASFMSANKPPHLRKTSTDALGKDTKPPPAAGKPPMTGKPPAGPKPKPTTGAKPAVQSKPPPSVKPSPPPPTTAPPPLTTGPTVPRDNITLSVTVPPQGSPRTPASPTPPGESTMASRFRRCPLKPVDTSNPPTVPVSTKPRLPGEGESLRLAVNRSPSPIAPHLANGPLRLAPPSGKTGNSPLPPRPEKPGGSPLPGRPPKPGDSTPPVLPKKDVTPNAGRRSGTSLSRSSSRASSLPRPASPPHSPPPPPVPVLAGHESDGGFDEVADEEDMYMPPMDEHPASGKADFADEDLADDVDDILDSMGGVGGPPPGPHPAAIPPSTAPPPLEVEDEIVEDSLYDDVENVANEVFANKARQEEFANNGEDAVDEPVYEVEAGQGLPPPSDDLYDDVPCGPGAVEEIPEETSEDELGRGIDQSGSFSDIAADSTDEWSHEEVLDDDPSPLPPPGSTMQHVNGQPPPGQKRKLSKRTKKRIKDEEKHKQQEERRAKEEAKKREREEREAAKIREKEAKENKRKEAERQKVVEKQRKHHKIHADHKPKFVAVAKSDVKKPVSHYLGYNAGDNFNVLFHESDKHHKLPQNAWLVERQLDGQVGFVVANNMQVQQQNPGADEIEAESMYEDVGQGSAVASAAFAAQSSMKHNMPPPTVRAPPVPTIAPTEPEEECLYEDLPN